MMGRNRSSAQMGSRRLHPTKHRRPPKTSTSALPSTLSSLQTTSPEETPSPVDLPQTTGNDQILIYR